MGAYLFQLRGKDTEEEKKGEGFNQLTHILSGRG